MAVQTMPEFFDIEDCRGQRLYIKLIKDGDLYTWNYVGGSRFGYVNGYSIKREGMRVVPHNPNRPRRTLESFRLT